MPVHSYGFTAVEAACLIDVIEQHQFPDHSPAECNRRYYVHPSTKIDPRLVGQVIHEVVDGKPADQDYVPMDELVRTLLYKAQHNPIASWSFSKNRPFTIVGSGSSSPPQTKGDTNERGLASTASGRWRLIKAKFVPKKDDHHHSTDKHEHRREDLMVTLYSCFFAECFPLGGSVGAKHLILELLVATHNAVVEQQAVNNNNKQKGGSPGTSPPTKQRFFEKLKKVISSRSGEESSESTLPDLFHQVRHVPYAFALALYKSLLVDNLGPIQAEMIKATTSLLPFAKMIDVVTAVHNAFGLYRLLSQGSSNERPPSVLLSFSEMEKYSALAMEVDFPFFIFY
jgi:hypothetical protein